MPEISPLDVERLAAYAAGWTGFAAGAIRREQIRRGAEKLLGMGKTLADVLARAAAADPAVVDHFCDTISVGETYFFRNPEQFRFLSDEVLPELLRSRPASLRVWSAGCATGEEAYSLAAALLAAVPAGAPVSERVGVQGAPTLEVLGTDLLERNVAAARRGRYESWSLRSSAGPLLLPLLEPDGEGAFRILSKIRAITAFRKHNLLGPPPERGGFDLVFCRNVLVYLSASAASTVCEHLAEALAPGGVLIVGAIETDRPPPGTEPFGPPGLGAYRRVRLQLRDSTVRPTAPALVPCPVGGVGGSSCRPTVFAPPDSAAASGEGRAETSRAAAVPEPVAVHLRAIDLIERGRWRAAEALLDELCRSAPDYLPGLLEQALLWTRTGQPRRAAERMRAILDRTASLPAETPIVGPEKLPLSYYRTSAEAFLLGGRKAAAPVDGESAQALAAGKWHG